MHFEGPRRHNWGVGIALSGSWGWVLGLMMYFKVDAELSAWFIWFWAAMMLLMIAGTILMYTSKISKEVVAPGRDDAPERL